jgi:hypothetical protein
MPHAAVVPATVEQRRTDISYEEMGLLPRRPRPLPAGLHAP